MTGVGQDLAAQVVRELQRHGLRLGVAESCTGGLLSALITGTPGASNCFAGAIVAYDNRANVKLLSVPEVTLETEGAVSQACVSAMAAGARRVLEADLGLALSGVAGPGGGTEDKPVGLVCFGLCTSSQILSIKARFSGKRAQVRQAAAERALGWLLDHFESLDYLIENGR